MAKVYIPGETKAQRKLRKAKEKANKNIKQPAVTVREKFPPVDQTADRWVLCLKHGNKYTANYVNVLYNMVKRNLSLPFKFACMTDDRKGLDPDIVPIDIPQHLSGWWCKPYMYSAELPLTGTILYMDLDVVIAGSLDKLFEYSQGDWCVIRDFTRAMQPNWQKYNSSVIRFNKGQLDKVWRDFNSNHEQIIKTHFGDQDWLWTSAQNTAKLWPDEWIRSWKWEIRKDRTLTAGEKGKRTFTKKEDVVPHKECCIAVFHGDPNPDMCSDPWVLNNWK